MSDSSSMAHIGETAQAIVIGANGAIGGAIVAALRDSGYASRVLELGRPDLDLEDEASIVAAARRADAGAGATRLVIDATGFLHGEGQTPEKSLRDLSYATLAHSFAINAIGPALLMKHFLPLLPRQGRGVFATLSARVGSIGDNGLGGWYGYRASTAALNQLVRTAAIELRRSRPQAICVALHPGTVASRLSAPFAKSGLDVRPPGEAANELLDVIGRLTPAMSGGFFDQHGEAIPW
ncbi:MAG: SDR family NAD(P)-dependent oxidoreductase [Alphaproteobacteria bacterium]